MTDDQNYTTQQERQRSGKKTFPLVGRRHKTLFHAQGGAVSKAWGVTVPGFLIESCLSDKSVGRGVLCTS